MKTNTRLGRNDKTYHYFEKDTATVRVTNDTRTPIHVSEVRIVFIVNDKKHNFTSQCNEKINPGKTAKLPSIEFIVGPWFKSYTIIFKIEFSYRLINKNKLSDPRHFDDSYTGSIMVTDSPKQDKKIFISHSNDREDKSVVENISNALQKAGFTPYVAEKHPKLGSNLWGKIRDEICDSDLFMVLCTARGSESRDVGEEIGFARGKDKKIIPIIEKGVHAPGSLLGEEYVLLDRKKIDDCMYRIIEHVFEWASEEHDLV